MEVADPLTRLDCLVTFLEQRAPQSCTYSPEAWESFEASWHNAQSECAVELPQRCGELRRWLRGGLDDDSFSVSRREVDDLQSLVSALISTDPLEPIFGVVERYDDGTEAVKAVLSLNQFWRLRDRLRVVRSAVVSLERWRDCRKNAPPPPPKPRKQGGRGRGRIPVAETDTARVEEENRLYHGWKNSGGLSQREYLLELRVDDIKKGIAQIERARKRLNPSPRKQKAVKRGE